jgi:hypothetical protein
MLASTQPSRATSNWGAVLLVVSTLAWISPAQASAQLGSLVVNVTAPASGARLRGTVPINASVTIVGALTVRSVQFKVDGVVVGEDTTAPYSAPWDTRLSSDGPHTVTACARDILGVVWDSAGVSVTVDNTPPAVTINQTAAQADPTRTAPVNFSVVFSEAVNGFAAADVVIGGTAGGTKSVAVSGGPTTYVVAVSGMTSGTVIPSIPAGRAQDATGNGNTASASTDNVVTFDTTPPSVTINQAAGQADPTRTAPINFSVVFNEAVNNFTAADVVVGGTAGGTKTVAVTGGPTAYVVAVSGMTGGTVTPSIPAGAASDAAGNGSTASTSTDGVVTFDTTPPTVAISSPANDSTVNGAVTVTADAADNVAVAGVQFRLDNAALGAEDLVAPYSVPWDTTAVANGPHTLSAVARDVVGNITSSAVIAVTVTNGTLTRVEETNAAVTFAPAGSWALGNTARAWSGGTAALGSSDGQRATLNFDGTSVAWIGFRGPQAGIAHVYLDGALAATVDLYAPMEEVQASVFTRSGLAAGPHTVAIEVPTPRSKNPASSDYFVLVDAFDILGDGTPPADTTAPSVAITAPNGTGPLAGTVLVSADATDDTGVVGVQFLLDGVMVTEDTTAPYSMNWDTRTSADGPHTLTAVARDAAGNSTTSAPVNVTVNNSQPPADTTAPSVAITAPNGAAPLAGTVAISADASDNVGVAGVSFFVDGVLLQAEDTTAPYSVNWDTRTGADGPHTLTAVARDAAGNSTTSAPVSVTVNNSPPPPPPSTTATRIEDTDLSVRFTPGPNGQVWFHGSRSRTWSDKTASFQRSAGARATFQFSGTSVTWISFRAAWAGIADVYVDGVFASRIDLYLGAGRDPAAPRCAQPPPSCVDEETQAPVFTRSGLSPGNHTLTIEVTGTQNPLASDNAVVVDGFEVSPGPPVPVTGTRVENTAAAVTYTGDWQHSETSRSTAAGARATFNFIGTAVRWVGLRGPQTGIARIYLDGAFHAEVDTYSPREIQADTFTVTDLVQAQHELTVEVTGLRNPASTGTLIAVDAFDIRSRIEESEIAAVAYSGDWRKENADYAWSGTSANVGVGTASISAAAGADATFNFNGTSVTWIGFRAPLAGIADVFLDGANVGRVDLYSPVEQLRAPVFTAAGLSAGPHTLRIAVTGERNPAASAPFVVVDAFDVTLPSTVQPVSRIQETDPAIAYSSTADRHELGWYFTARNTYWTGERTMESSLAGARATLTFTGTSVAWIGQRGRLFGIARVTLDGGVPVDIDLYGTGQDEFQVAVFKATGLTPGTHTLTIDVTGLKNAASDSAIVLIDAFDIH